MSETQLVTQYNYDSFVPEKFIPWMNFEKSPGIGQVAPDFPLWGLDRKQTSLSEIWGQFDYTVVEFGSFT